MLNLYTWENWFKYTFIQSKISKDHFWKPVQDTKEREIKFTSSFNKLILRKTPLKKMLNV